MPETLAEIKETQRQVSATKSPMRKRDLQKRLTKLWRKYNREKREMR